MGVTAAKWIEFDAGHRVPGHKDPDGSERPGACSSPHGHRYRVEVAINGDVRPDGMVLDFGIVKRLLMEKVHDVLDHAMVLADDDPLLALLDEHGDTIRPGGFKVYALDGAPTAENLAAWIANEISYPLTQHMIELVRVTVWETPSSSATWEPQRWEYP